MQHQVPSKPLPAIPALPPARNPAANPSPTTLSLEAREHRARFIRYILADAALDDPDDEWAQAFEEALDGLSDAVARGRWLAGVKGRRSLNTPNSTSANSTSADSDLPDADTDALMRIRALAARPTPPTPQGHLEPKHLVLCLAPLGSTLPVPAEDSGFALIPANVGCTFTPSVYALETEDSVLYGLREWDAAKGNDVKLIGGTFTLRNLSSSPSPLAQTHTALARALRLATYTHLSLLLEQHFLRDSGVSLRFAPRPKPRLISLSTTGAGGAPPPPMPTPQFELTPPGGRGRHTKNKSFLPGILSFFSKKNQSLGQQQRPGYQARGGGSLDLSAVVSRLSSDAGEASGRRSFSSFLGPKNGKGLGGDGTTFPALLALLTRAAPLLSASPTVRFEPPAVVVRLAAKEAEKRRLRGDERVGLGSVLGWDAGAGEAREARGRGMVGARGFARMQELSVLVSRHVPCPDGGEGGKGGTGTVGVKGSATALSASASSAGGHHSLAPCGRPHPSTFQYYAHNAGGEGNDRSLGAALERMAGDAGGPCRRCAEGCAWREGEHVGRIVHGGVRVGVTVKRKGGGEDEAKEGAKIRMWASCAVCGVETPRVEMSDGTYLFSYAKFLEVLIYSRLTPVLCDHTAPATPSPKEKDGDEHRFNVVRHFERQAYRIDYSLSRMDDVYELRVPRLQIVGGAGTGARTSLANSEGKEGPAVDEEKRALRREIKAWWEGVADHLDGLETTIVGSTLVGFRKALPRLPSVDDAYFDLDDSASEDDGGDESDATTPTTPRRHPHLVAGLPPSAPTTPQIQRTAQELFPSPPPASPPPFARASSDPTNTPTAATVAPTGDSLELLTSLRQHFHAAEQALYAQLATTPVGALNDVRRAFMIAAKGAEKRLAAWQKKHLVLPGRSKGKKKQLEMAMVAPEPEWWGNGCHTAPGCNVIVREDDWGSIIAFTMSTADYARELASMSVVQRGSGGSSLASPQPVLTPTVLNDKNSSASSFFSAKQLFTASTQQAQPDPDQDDTVWYEPEAYSAVISRKEHPRDATSLLSLREVLRQKSPTLDGVSIVGGSSSRFSSLGSAATKGSGASGLVPPSAWSKPDVQISRHAVGGEVSMSGSGEATAEEVGRILHEIEASSGEGRPASALAGSFFADMHVRRGKAASVISMDSDTTVDGRSKEGDDAEDVRHGKEGSSATEVPAAPTPTPSSFTNTLTSGISSAMRLLLSNGEIPRPSMFSKNHHGLLGPAIVDAFAIDERPHIKYDWTVGKRLKFSCTVYYARQFDNLRRRCGIEDVFIKSLSRSANWAAEGGKSKSNFWKTADDRFIIKTLVNAWNVADLQVLIELAPSYFRYMDATASKATVLAKLIGFYTIEIRNLETGNVQSKADLLVMENLFYDQKIVKTFDLKGIQGRKVKSSASGTAKDVKTLFDGEWIEGQQRTLTLVRPHSKVVLHEAIKSDAEFLAKSNIMDYSLLLGVDQERKEIVCGLVDTIGSYTFAKTLEYKAKQGLNGNSGKEVTVIPPTEYQERFVSALEGYFLACPDKWSRSTDENTKPIEDPGMLPSVL
ncbi:hypothetical protein DFH08DRAFT_786154 [Mycena albidolilacea]|uniref:PIPK domain-containing protein n=1 Tax=Mycena albidolilacea TaxID=1033008 RepID=A0AAD6ZMS7_9AGAR|nr:hypothetical protein DFH08DRAFT_786154 [Mycena albidolilacea]